MEAINVADKSSASDAPKCEPASTCGDASAREQEITEADLAETYEAGFVLGLAEGRRLQWALMRAFEDQRQKQRGSLSAEHGATVRTLRERNAALEREIVVATKDPYRKF